MLVFHPNDMIHDIRLRISHRDDDPVFQHIIRVCCQVGGKAGQGGTADEFPELIIIFLYEKARGGHLLTAHLIPESNLRAQQKVKAIEHLKCYKTVSGQGMVFCDADGKGLP